MNRPNVLIIKSDQHNARCLGVNGHKQVKTPNLDELAGTGVNFTRAFTQNPICSPSRATYFCGQYPHNHGVYGLTGTETLPDGLPSVFSVFKENGYRTGLAGTSHVRDDWVQPHCDMYREFQITDNYYDAYLSGKGLKHLRDDVDYRGQGISHDGCASELSFEDTFEGYCLQCFSEFLDDQPSDQPFYFELAPEHPHQNYMPVKEFWEMYDDVELELPPSADEDLSDKPPHQQRQREAQKSNPNMWLFDPKTYEAGRLRKLQGYYGCISQVDHMVGLARKKLQEKGLTENTIVLYCTDHGEFALEHGFTEKAPGISYDAVTRIPFIWNWPGGNLTTGTVEEFVETVDLFPTLCSLLKISPPDTLDGKDFSKMLFGDTSVIHDFVITEFPLSRVIRTKEWKLVHRPRGMFKENDDPGELYHMTEDPWEMTNLYGDPQYAEIREELRRTLFDWTQLNTRYGNVWPHKTPGADGKTTVADLKAMVKNEWPDVVYL